MQLETNFPQVHTSAENPTQTFYLDYKDDVIKRWDTTTKAYQKGILGGVAMPLGIFKISDAFSKHVGAKMLIHCGLDIDLFLDIVYLSVMKTAICQAKWVCPSLIHRWL